MTAHSLTRRGALTTFIAGAAALALAPQVASASEAAVFSDFWGNAIKGTDPVAYFKEGKPVAGSSDHELEWNGATWRFSSAANKAAFEADPEAFAPQYGGYCAWAVAQGYTASIDPEAWSIVDGKLYLNYSKSVQSNWEKDIPGNIAKGDANWPKIIGG